MTRNIDSLQPEDGATVPPEQIPTAVTAGRLAYGDGTTQIFQPDGSTSYFEAGRQTEGTWSVDENGRSAPSGRLLPSGTCQSDQGR